MRQCAIPSSILLADLTVYHRYITTVVNVLLPRLSQNLSRSKSNDSNGNRSGSAGGGTVPAPPPKGGSVPANPAYQGSLKSTKNGPSSASSSFSSLSSSATSAAPSHAPYNVPVYPTGQGTPQTRLLPHGVNNLADKTPPAPPVVVVDVSSEMPADPIPHSVATASQPSSSITPFHHTGSPGSPLPPGAAMASLSSTGIAASELATPPKAASLTRLRQSPSNSGPKDTIPITSKTPPRKQRSSRFHVTEKVELEKLPHFNGMCPSPRFFDPHIAIQQLTPSLFGSNNRGGPRGSTRALRPKASSVFARVRLQRRQPGARGQADQSRYTTRDA